MAVGAAPEGLEAEAAAAAAAIAAAPLHPRNVPDGAGRGRDLDSVTSGTGHNIDPTIRGLNELPSLPRSSPVLCAPGVRSCRLLFQARVPTTSSWRRRSPLRHAPVWRRTASGRGSCPSFGTCVVTRNRWGPSSMCLQRSRAASCNGHTWERGPLCESANQTTGLPMLGRWACSPVGLATAPLRSASHRRTCRRLVGISMQRRPTCLCRCGPTWSAQSAPVR
mmetsp:Transcript_15340/g.48182  ORF Transcript_15340/g.48182 Transcript_15340/m.48182 type:complete len:222 (+) Transcript_15340:133-798(+)